MYVHLDHFSSELIKPPFALILNTGHRLIILCSIIVNYRPTNTDIPTPTKKAHVHKFLNLQFIIWLPKTQYSETRYQLFIISYPCPAFEINNTRKGKGSKQE